MNLKRVAAIAASMWAVIAGLYLWFNFDWSAVANKRLPLAKRKFTVAYIPVT